jgi:K+-sensing histidine kinase KdpD
MMNTLLRRDVFKLVIALAFLSAATAGYRLVLHHSNPTTAAMTYLLVILVTAAASRVWVAIVTSIAADLCLNYFFMPPFGTFTIADPQNWVALFVFLAVSMIGSRISTALRDREAADQARKNEEVKSALLASLAHDLKTPLTAIRVAASNLKASWLPETGREEQSDVILAEVERLSRLFHNMLELARLDGGAVAANPGWVHPAEILEAARDQVEPSLRHHGVDVDYRSGDLVRVDARLTGAALAHLLENAAHYAPHGSAINVRISVSDDGLMVQVRDRGPGIAVADLPHVFERFYRGAGARSRASGTGMGLSIARGMMSAQLGRIWAENCADGGARFTIVVPADHKPAAAEV